MNAELSRATPSIMYKAVGLDYTSHAGRPRTTLHWDVGSIVTHPGSKSMIRHDDPSTYLWLDVKPDETLGLVQPWPCRLLEVEPLGDVIDWHRDIPCVLQVRVVREIEAWLALGPQGEYVAALIDRAKRLTRQEAQKLADAPEISAWHDQWDAMERAYDHSRDPVLPAGFINPRYAAQSAAQSAASAAVEAAAGGLRNMTGYSGAQIAAKFAAWALVVRDLIGTDSSWTQRGYDELVSPWSYIIGKVHPSDAGVLRVIKTGQFTLWDY